MPTWDPDVYARFADERSRPFEDLLQRVAVGRPQRVVDLGCGRGALTATLARRWPGARVVGVDSSPQMVAAARAGRHAGCTFIHGDVRDWEPAGPVDVVVANAVLQWVPGHLDLLASWVSRLAPSGWLALQVPGNFDAPSHALMRQVAARTPYAERLDGVLRGGQSVSTPLEYATALGALGCRVDAWETTYLHLLDPAGAHGPDAVLAWVRGTALRPVLDALAGDASVQERFVEEYAALLREAYPAGPLGTPLPFRRVFAVAQRHGDQRDGDPRDGDPAHH